jgi:hypothetical protein
MALEKLSLTGDPARICDFATREVKDNVIRIVTRNVTQRNAGVPRKWFAPDWPWAAKLPSFPHF